MLKRRVCVDKHPSKIFPQICLIYYSLLVDFFVISLAYAHSTFLSSDFRAFSSDTSFPPVKEICECECQINFLVLDTLKLNLADRMRSSAFVSLSGGTLCLRCKIYCHDYEIR